MKHFQYQLVVQWDTRSGEYIAYAPTLSTFAAKFLPDYSCTANGKSMQTALANAEFQYENLFYEARSLGILLPATDIGPADPVGYQAYNEDLGKMVL